MECKPWPRAVCLKPKVNKTNGRAQLFARLSVVMGRSRKGDGNPSTTAAPRHLEKNEAYCSLPVDLREGGERVGVGAGAGREEYSSFIKQKA